TSDLMGLQPARKGTIRFLGKEIQQLSPHQISRLGIGLVPQGRRIFPSLTVRENLTIAARQGKASDKQMWTLEKVYEMFPILKEREHNKGTELSGGQQQMLAIGRALLTNPQLLIMDEPSEGLAPVVIEQVGEAIQKLKQSGLSIFIIEQNISLACYVADEILIMNKGQIVWRGNPHELLHDTELQRLHLG